MFFFGLRHSDANSSAIKRANLDALSVTQPWWFLDRIRATVPKPMPTTGAYDQLRF